MKHRLYTVRTGVSMPMSTVSIPFQDDFLFQIDQIANNESKTRSELIWNAVRLYIDQKKEFEELFKMGNQIGSTLDISEDDVMGEIKNYRKTKQQIT
jgi:metal-responsive CopG/Arc/MetJ family transcriptional regulator